MAKPGQRLVWALDDWFVRVYMGSFPYEGRKQPNTRDDGERFRIRLPMSSAAKYKQYLLDNYTEWGPARLAPARRSTRLHRRAACGRNHMRRPPADAPPAGPPPMRRCDDATPLRLPAWTSRRRFQRSPRWSPESPTTSRFPATDRRRSIQGALCRSLPRAPE